MIDENRINLSQSCSRHDGSCYYYLPATYNGTPSQLNGSGRRVAVAIDKVHVEREAAATHRSKCVVLLVMLYTPDG